MAVSRMRSEKYAIKRLFMAESPKFPYPIKNPGRETRWWRQILNRKWKYGRFAHAQYKIRYITLIYGGMSKILALYRKSGSRNMTVTSDFRPLIYGGIAEIPPSDRKSGLRNTMVTSDFKPEVKIWPFCACAVQNTLYYLIYGGMSEILASCRKSGSRNMMVTSDFRPEVEIWPFRACAVKNTL